MLDTDWLSGCDHVRAAPSVNKSHIPSLPKNNPYLYLPTQTPFLIEQELVTWHESQQSN